MADKSQRTEKATPKHRKEMREKGTVARSTELGGWGSFLLVSSLLPSFGSSAAGRISGFMKEATLAMGHPSLELASGLLGKGLMTAIYALMPLMIVGSAAGVAVSVAQVGLRFTPQALALKFSRISPKAGFSRMLSKQGFWTLGKTVLKFVVLAAVGFSIMRKLVGNGIGDGSFPLQVTISTAISVLVKLIRFIGVLALAIAGADYYFERRKYQQDLRMTKQETKQEYRENEGSPELRREVRSRARQLSRMRMMAAIASADVVVTNPTHFAVAVAYDRKNDRAPRVVAKGADFIAFAIRDRARSCGVTVVENPGLARTLYGSCEVDDVIPARLYAAVAQLLAFVYSLSPAARVLNDVHRMSG